MHTLLCPQSPAEPNQPSPFFQQHSCPIPFSLKLSEPACQCFGMLMTFPAEGFFKREGSMRAPLSDTEQDSAGDNRLTHCLLMDGKCYSKV